MKKLLIDSHRIMNHREKDIQHVNDRILILQRNLDDFVLNEKDRIRIFLVIVCIIHHQDLILVDLRMIQ